ncbi:MAG: F0F1 ATP synthase subunit A, partial [Nitrospira sp.]|nr:F0F1 ATP synthase subunit A [Nitrospira sp.]
MENPLHPFELHPLIHLSLLGVDISLNKAVLMMWVVVALVAGLLIAAGTSRRLVPTKLQSLAELL